MRIKQFELLRTLEEVEKHAEKRKTKIDSTLLIREERERKSTLSV